jgi:glycosyltransferase involved in cell wall biosynthesis
MSITFCTANKGYTKYLKQVYKNNLDVANDPKYNFVLLNYDSPDDMEQWVRTELRDYIRTGKLIYEVKQNLPIFNMAKSKNLSHSYATGDYICNLDADNILTTEFLEWMDELIATQPPFITHGSSHGAGGRVIVKRTDFINMGGYNENYELLGDHHELVRLGVDHGLKPILVPDKLAPALDNTISDRGKYSRLSYEETERNIYPNNDSWQRRRETWQ